jgi:hypothetical protein
LLWCQSIDHAVRSGELPFSVNATCWTAAIINSFTVWRPRGSPGVIAIAPKPGKIAPRIYAVAAIGSPSTVPFSRRTSISPLVFRSV